MKVIVVLLAVLALTVAATGINNVDNPSIFRKMIAKCLASDDTVTCLSIKAITALNRAARSANIEILPGVSFQRDSTISARTARALTENEIIDSLPAEESERSERLFDLAMDSLTNFIESHSLQVKFPKENSQAFARVIEEGRGKMKKMMLALCAKLIAGLVFKALIASKIALYLASRGHHHGALVSRVTASPAGGGGWQSGAQSAGWSSGTGVAAQYPYGRSYDNMQDLTYNTYAVEIPAFPRTIK